jgi:hypothetical protein
MLDTMYHLGILAEDAALRIEMSLKGLKEVSFERSLQRFQVISIGNCH